MFAALMGLPPMVIWWREENHSGSAPHAAACGCLAGLLAAAELLRYGAMVLSTRFIFKAAGYALCRVHKLVPASQHRR